MNDWEDRWIDAGLHELHGQRPPDLSARVIAALEQPPQDGAQLVIARTAAGGRRRMLPFVAVGLMAAAAVVAAVVWWPRAGTRVQPEQVVARIDVVVTRGAVECVEADSVRAVVTKCVPGVVGSFAARPGNRLRLSAPSLVQLGPFGFVEAQQTTELEVKSMEFSWKSGVVAASTLTVAVVAGLVTWHGFTHTEAAAAGETIQLRAGANGEDAASLAAENARLRRRNEQLEQEVAALKVVPEREPAAQPPAKAPAPEKPPEAVTSSMTFTDPQFAKALEGIDWKTMGTVTNEMGPLLVELVEAMRDGKEMPPELGVKISELNMKLVAQLPALMKAGLPGYGPNGAYTHPLVVGNVLASTLAAAGHPLSPAQQAKIEGLVRGFSAETQSIAAASHEFELEQLLAETETKDRFYAELASQLAPEQNDTMYPKGAKDYDGAGLFGTGLITRPYSEGVAAANASDFARAASSRLGEDLGLDEASAAKVRAVVERVVGAAPELWRDPTDATERNLKMWKSGRTTAALKRQIEVMREIQRQVPMTPEQAKKFKAMKGVLVPLPK